MKKDMVKVYVLIIVGVVILTVVGTTFAFFSLGVVNEGASGVTYELTDKANLIFEKGDDLVIDANLENFSMSGSNLSSTTTAKVTLEATENYTSEYYLYFEISSNNFIYTTEEEIPELILIVQKPDGTLVTEIEGLEYVTYDGVKGFDVTTNEGWFTVGSPEWISLNWSNSNQSISNEWKFTLYFMNLDTNQNENSGKVFQSNIVMDVSENNGPYIMYGTLSAEILRVNAYNETGTIYSIGDSMLMYEEKGTPDYSEITGEVEGLFAAEDDFGTSYYFRGAQENNYVLFADMLWRIVRIDGEGNVKLMLFNESSEGRGYVGMNSNTAYYFNTIKTTSIYGGYMYTSSQMHGTGTSSTVKTAIDTWYSGNIAYTEYDQYISKSAIYCNDRTSYSSYSGTTEYTSYSSTASVYFGAFIRNSYDFGLPEVSPTLKCLDVGDAFTVEEHDYGNGALTYGVAMINADEVVMASMAMVQSLSSYASIGNKDSYLYAPNNYFTLSPIYYNYASSSSSRYVTLSAVSSYYGHLDRNYNISSTALVYPTLSLKYDTMFNSGNGSLENPYTINVETDVDTDSDAV